MSAILYLGPEGTHSHDAALRHFGNTQRLEPCLSHRDIFIRLRAGSKKRGGLQALVPVENSTEGPVTQTLDLLAAHPEISIIESFSLPVRHYLMTHNATRRVRDIKRVYSHPQALGQCSTCLDKFLPNAERIAEASTAAAAARISTEPESAAIASAIAADLYNLKILKSDIQDSSANTTRFMVLSTKKNRINLKSCETERIRSLMYVVLHNRPGALLHALAPFDAAGVNLTFIQSRPLPGRPWEYAFFIEAATNWSDPAHVAAWQLITALADSGRKIGTYIHE